MPNKVLRVGRALQLHPFARQELVAKTKGPRLEVRQGDIEIVPAIGHYNGVIGAESTKIRTHTDTHARV